MEFPPYPDASNVVWETPSRDSSGSMPLGNGDIGLNAWVEEDGDLLFYIGKTDAWSENARLLKVGRIRVHLEPNPFRKGMPFRQTLHLRQGEIAILAGRPSVALRLWVDAHRPVVRLEMEGEEEFAVEARLELWRLQERELKGRELFSAYGMQGGPYPVIVYPDTVWPTDEERIVWFHRNEHSIWPLTLRLQGLEPLMERFSDPLLHRTFGGAIEGTGLKKVSEATLRAVEKRRRFLLSVYLLTAQTATVEEWLRRLEALIHDIEAVPLEEARRAHRRWWEEFWERSSIQVVGSAPSEPMAVNDLPLRIGADSEGENQFRGRMRRAWLFARALKPEEILALMQGEAFLGDPARIGDWALEAPQEGAFANRALPDLPARIVGRVETEEGAVRFIGQGWLEVALDPRLQLTQAVTLAAWIQPEALPPGGGRILDKSKAGTSNGYLLDTYPGNSLRMIVQANTLTHAANLPPGRWVFVAATYDAATGEQRLFVDGRLVAFASLGGDGFRITQGYTLQRFINACGGRGAYPIKFNGSIFTVDAQEGEERFDADYRRWGGPYWFQNTRLAYWPMLMAGDYDLMEPLFRMYRDILPLCLERTRLYFGHGGAFFPETLTFWGCYANENYGWNREGKPISHVDNTYIRHHYEGGLELVAMMLDFFAHTQEESFAREFLLPIAEAVVAFYDEHYPRDEGGKLLLKPAQALETWQDVVNPLPDIAGLRWVLEGLLQLPLHLTSPEQRSRWERLRSELPPLPMGQEGEERFLLPAQEILGPLRNQENPELYAVFPFRLYGVGKPDLEVGRATFRRRRFKNTGGWQQDAIQAAYLGLAETAMGFTARNFATHHAGSRFPAFWGPNFDWVPDQDHGSVAMMALQAMLLQAEGDRIRLLPAWPKGWDVSFRLHAPRRTVVEGVYRGGRWERLVVLPPERRKDVEFDELP